MLRPSGRAANAGGTTLPRMSPRHATLRRLLAVLLGLALLVGAELGLRAAGYPPETPWTPSRLAYVVNNGVVKHAMLMPEAPRFVRDEATGEMVTNPEHAANMRPQRFAAAPTPGRPRIFVIGESAVVGQAGGRIEGFLEPPGVPGPDRSAFGEVEPLPGGPAVWREKDSLPARLAAVLEASGRPAEVINMGRIAQDSLGHLVSVREALALGADGLVLYYGNNESISIARELDGEKIPALEGTRTALRRLYLYRLLVGVLVRPEVRWETLGGLALDRAREESELPGRVVDQLWTLANKPLVKDGLPDDIVQDAIISRFERYFGEIVQTARTAGVPVWFVACPPALHYPPFRSGHDPLASAAALAAADRAYEEGVAALRAGDVSTALAAARRATGLDPASARSLHLLAAAEEGAGQPDAATDALLAALALDQSHKRATPALGAVARRICAGGGCVVGDLHGQLVAEARQRGPWATYGAFHADFDHPLPAGHQRLAELFAGLMTELPPRPRP